MGIRFVWRPLEGELVDAAHIDFTATSEPGSSQLTRVNAHTTEVWWPTEVEVCDRVVVRSSPREGRAGV